MVYIKAAFPKDIYEAALQSLWSSLFEHHRDISEHAITEALQGRFGESAVTKIIEAASSDQVKRNLTENTQKALDLGAFGAPYFAVRNKHGNCEFFFGSDR